MLLTSQSSTELVLFVAWRALGPSGHGLESSIFAEVVARVGGLLVHFRRCDVACLNWLFIFVQYSFWLRVCAFYNFAFRGLAVVSLRLTFWLC